MVSIFQALYDKHALFLSKEREKSYKEVILLF